MSGPALTHIDSTGEASMVDVGDKAETVRVAVAEGFVRMKPETLALIRQGNAKKGDVIATARLAGIMAAKQTSSLIPLCHPLMLTKVAVDITRMTPSRFARPGNGEADRTDGCRDGGVTAVSVACLTIYDMAKAADREMEIGGVRLVSKSGGRSGDYHRAGELR